MPDSTLSGLRQLMASLDRERRPQADETTAGFLGTGHPDLDRALGGGLARGALHELFAAGAADAGALRGAAIAIAALASSGGRPVLWITQGMVAREAGAPHAPGLALMGCDPDRLVLVAAADTPALLKAANDAARSPVLGAIVAEAWGRHAALDLTATRRLTLAARGSGALVVLVRLGAEPAPSAAETRWRVASAPSVPLAAGAPGLPVFDLTLLRHRRGISGATWRVAWMCHERKFVPVSLAATGPSAAPGAPLPGDLAAASADRSAAATARGRLLRLAG